MKNRLTFLLLFFFGIFLFPENSLAQKVGHLPTDDLGNVSDDFQEYFFEALKQKGIENYELALIALEKAIKATYGNKENKAVVYFEMAKNLSKLKRYEEAEINFKKVIAWQDDRLDVLEALYQLYYMQQDYNSAITLVIRLIEFDSHYKEDLANLYVRAHQYHKALNILDELEKEWGESRYRNSLRNRAYKAIGNLSIEISKLKAKIKNDPKNEKNYLKLIYLYSEEGKTKNAFETSKELLKQNPKSQLVHLALYKLYLEQGNLKEAISSMKTVFGSDEIDEDSKNKVLGDFLAYAKNNPEQDVDLSNILGQLSVESNSELYKQLGDFYLSKGKRSEALEYYEKGNDIDIQNYSLLKSTIMLQMESKEYKKAAGLSFKGIDIFPAQPLLYLLNGKANNKLNKPDPAIESLETGLDYLFEDLKMEYEFYEQLSISYTLKGDRKKVEEFSKKASDLKLSN